MTLTVLCLGYLVDASLGNRARSSKCDLSTALNIARYFSYKSAQSKSDFKLSNVTLNYTFRGLNKI